jgi:hypothetical protein
MTTYTPPTAETPWGRLDAELGDRETRKIGNNTYARRLAGPFGPIAVRLHQTDVVTAYCDGSVVLNSGGWRTVTTKDRIGRYLPGYSDPDGWRVHCNVHSSNGVWRVSRSAWRDAATADNPYASEWSGGWVSDFYDGLTIGPDGTVADPMGHDGTDPDRAVKRDIRRYVERYTDDEIARLLAGAQDHGTAGDCWFCAMGEGYTDPDHLREHIREGYTMATLAYNACKARGYMEPVVILTYSPDLVRKAIRRYLTQRLATNTTGATPTGQNYSATHPGQGPWG